MRDFVQTIIGVLVGGLITALFAQLYYVRASRDLTAEADRGIQAVAGSDRLPEPC